MKKNVYFSIFFFQININKKRRNFTQMIFFILLNSTENGYDKKWCFFSRLVKKISTLFDKLCPYLAFYCVEEEIMHYFAFPLQQFFIAQRK